eukprot:TRINITY_DN121999_c0_g1_i1.p1 TRINITY_DN121999_c0_g1~~TRINITY_DN121999_c0_g1_i1.p1  ORF type:complete len:507 (+),score=72.93 TRINITY_DN121999_c0_g1_i1:285-1805(+)
MSMFLQLCYRSQAGGRSSDSSEESAGSSGSSDGSAGSSGSGQPGWCSGARDGASRERSRSVSSSSSEDVAAVSSRAVQPAVPAAPVAASSAQAQQWSSLGSWASWRSTTQPTEEQKQVATSFKNELEDCVSSMQELRSRAPQLQLRPPGDYTRVLFKVDCQSLGGRLQSLAERAADAGHERSAPGALTVAERAAGLLEELTTLAHAADVAGASAGLQRGAASVSPSPVASPNNGALIGGMPLQHSTRSDVVHSSGGAFPLASNEEDQLASILRGVGLAAPDGDALSYVSHKILDSSRAAVVATAFPEAATSQLVAVTGRGGSGQQRELIGVLTGGDPPSVNFLSCSCQIMFEDLSPSECVEYVFAEEPQTWRMAQLSRDALEAYRGMKFEAWKKMLLEPSCEAAFRRMLQIGIVTRMYDAELFPTPPSLKQRYEVQDERSGKLMQLPHPVSQLRIWNASTQQYEAIDALLDGAPAQAQAAAWWAGFINELGSTHGQEYIAKLQAGQ